MSSSLVNSHLISNFEIYSLVRSLDIVSGGCHNNRVIETDNRITAILACIREGVAGIYIQKKLDELDKELGTQDWDNFVKEIKMIFSNKSKVADAEWKIETFKQGKQNTADFIIEFEALAIKADTDELHAIFLLKKNA